MARAMARGVGLCAAIAVWALPASADDVADFYKGKTFNLVVGHEAGSGFDVYGRALARHLGRYIPGHPTVVVQNMNGASGVIAVNWLYNIAPRDGATVATFTQSAVFDPLLGNASAKYESAKFTWIGNMDESIGTCGVSKASGIGKFDDLFARESVLGATGISGPFGKFSAALNNLLGAKIKIVAGYRGTADVKIAIQRREVQGICGLPMSTITSFWRDLYESGDFKVIVQLSGRKRDDLKDIPRIADYAKTADDRQVFDLIFETLALGRVFAAPPGTPADRTKALRTAFNATVKDPQFLADAAKSQIDIGPATGEEVAAFIARVSAVPPAVVERAKAALRTD
jgi:tripartite-type tricarboxylate transporter receptor subunit TctC